jgi:hypothetical protein
MDGDVTALGGTLSTGRDVKAGMISVLLTGKIRLVESGKCGTDGIVTALGGILSTAREVKQGMMQELLTGRVRLV